MKAFNLLFSLFSFTLLLPYQNEARNQADELRKLIKLSKVSLINNYHRDYRYDTSSILSSIYSPVYISKQDGLMEADKIDKLPGQPKVPFDQYGGYVTVDEKNGRALYYYFVESPQNSSNKPLVLWLNGGPGCSSLGYGAMEELGPFRVNKDGKTLSLNPYAWNNVANVLFLESPAGVGFSYSNTTSDYKTSGDKKTKVDTYTFLVNWLERFPQYKTSDFFITGESYAGHYVPDLAQLILSNNKITNQTVINLRGIAIGNAYIDSISNIEGGYEFNWAHALVSDDTYATIKENCNYTTGDLNSKCTDAMDLADNESGDIDAYNIYAPNCDGTNSKSGVAMADFDPCSDYYVYAYLNTPAVQKALHANVTNLSHDWEPCSDVVNYIERPHSMFPVIKDLIASGLNFWLYSGDVDSVVPVTSTRYSIRMLGLPIKKHWQAWYHNKEVGGYVEEYSGLTLVTVRGSGHTVPSYQPERALAMITSFLHGELPSTTK